jgi:hypothetical protein
VPEASETPLSPDQKKDILTQVREGKLSAAEAEMLLRAGR